MELALLMSAFCVRSRLQFYRGYYSDYVESINYYIVITFGKHTKRSKHLSHGDRATSGGDAWKG